MSKGYPLPAGYGIHLDLLHDVMIKYQDLYPVWLKELIIKKKFDLTFLDKVATIRKHNAKGMIRYIYLIYGGQ